MKVFLKIGFILLVAFPVYAQQLPQFTQYMYNTISINPAYAGSRDALSVVGLHRSQWVGFNDGPVTQSLSIHSPLRNDKIGIGLSLINDNLGKENFVYAYGDFSYTIRTGEATNLAFGLKGGITKYGLDSDFRESESHDPSIYGIENRSSLNFGAGLYWYSDKWYVSFSIPKLLNNDRNEEQRFESLEKNVFYFTSGYVFNLNKDVKLRPSVLLKGSNGSPLSLDITTSVYFFEKLWLGANYRLNEATGSLGFLADFQISNNFRVGYAYEYPIGSAISSYTSGTHELFLIYEFKFLKKKLKSPRYF